MKKSHVEFIKISLLLFLLYKIISNCLLNNIEGGPTGDSKRVKAGRPYCDKDYTLIEKDSADCNADRVIAPDCGNLIYNPEIDESCDYYTADGYNCEKPDYYPWQYFEDLSCVKGSECNPYNYVCDFDGDGEPGCKPGATAPGCPGVK